MAYGDVDNQVQAYESKGLASLKQMQQTNPKLLAGIAIENLTRDMQERERADKMSTGPAGASVIDKKLGLGSMPGLTSQQAIATAAPGLEMQGQQMKAQQGQSGMQPSAQMGAPNMARQMAGGGIVEYAKGGIADKRLKTGSQPAIPVGNSNQPIPMLMQKYGGEKVLGYLTEKKALDAKAKAISEAGSAAGSMQVGDLRNMQEIFSEKYRDIISESMGMAKGGIVEYAKGGPVQRFQQGLSIEGEESPLTADGDEYRFNGELISAAEYAQIARQINATGLPVNNNKRPDWNRGRAAPGAVLDVVKGNMREVNDAIIDPERNPIYRAGRGIRDYVEDPDRNIVYKAGKAGLGALGDMVNYTPSDTSLDNAEFVGVEKMAEELGMQSEADRAAAEAAAEARRIEELNAANIEALGIAEEESSPKTLAEMLMRAQEQFNAGTLPEVKEEEEKEEEEIEKKGIADLMQSDNAKSILDVIRKLGYAGGASKGYEGQALFQGIQAERDAETKAGRDRDMLDAELEGRMSLMKEENKMRIAAQQGVAAADYRGTLSDQYMMGTEAYRIRKEKLLADAGASFWDIDVLTDSEEEEIATQLAAYVVELREAEMQTYTGMLSQFNGANNQTGVSEQPPSAGSQYSIVTP